MERILVPVDGSAGSLKATAFAARLAADTGASLVLVHVYDAPGAAHLGLTAMSKEELTAAQERLSEGHFAAARAEIGVAGSDQGGLEVRQLTELGDPAETLVECARREGIDLVVMGSRGLSPVRELLLGSVSEKVMRTCPCPVTIVR
jgi:nucleotide-binding universal stress UspA family protein